ncbi:MAG TPA: DUF92 domain-containing protein [Candidatus Poseidoniaceae archaeon]|nr:MAG TPA: DUF92 domain-containing protein [Candidatus Poseidoniales archaeon]HIH53528.1 DUF92 domain-containing protein [Candidatus Poseidoniaceae archaeon]
MVWDPGLNQGNLVVVVGLIAALLLLSTRAKVLDKSGLVAAVVLAALVGGLGHWTWLLLLLSFLASSHLATKHRFEEKAAKGMSESGDGSRRWTNVVANGGMPGLVVLFAFFFDAHDAGLWVFAASVAVATSDTWASEFGCLDDRVRMITTLQRCEPGLNGGVSPRGQAAAFGGAALISILAFGIAAVTGDGSGSTSVYEPVIVLLAGFLGCQLDSVLGAVLENRGLMTKGTVNAASILVGSLGVALLLGFP